MHLILIIISLISSRIVRKPLILAFHRIIDNDGSVLNNRIGLVSPKVFKRAINFLLWLGYEFVDLNTLFQTPKKKKRLAAITFDDGYKDLYTNAYPYLKSKNIPFTLFATTSTIDSDKLLWLHKLYASVDRLNKTSPIEVLDEYCRSKKIKLQSFPNDVIMHQDMKQLHEIIELLYEKAKENSEEFETQTAQSMYLTANEIKEMQRNGLDVEFHTHLHYPLANQQKDSIIRDLKESHEIISKHFNVNPNYWCLQFGQRNKHVNEIAADLNIIGIMSGPLKLIDENEDMYNLPRIEFADSIKSFHKKLCKAFIKSLLRR
jgi:peptidoglycan/xylan/chitin deacetylase (PgdA/CDA1 family)